MLYMTGRPRRQESNTSNPPPPTLHPHTGQIFSSISPAQYTHTSTPSYQDGFLISENALLELPSVLHTQTHAKSQHLCQMKKAITR